MQKKRPRGNGGARGGTVMGRRKRVRTRLVAGVAVTGIVVLAAGTPALLHASARLDHAQQLLTLARLDSQAVSLSRSLADERDQVVVFVAAGRPAKDTGGGSGQKADEGSDDGSGDGSDGDGSGGDGSDGDADSLRAAGDRVDRQITEIHAILGGSMVPAGYAGSLKNLGEVPSIRRTAVTGKGSAIAAYTSYSQVITSLQRLVEQLADHTSGDAAAGARAEADLDRAAGQASATRGLLLAALAVPVGEPAVNPMTGLPMEGSDSGTANGKERDALSAAAQLARVRELAALDDFDRSADTAERRAYTDTVAGTGVKTAEDYLSKLTAAPQLSDADLDTDRDKLNTALTARIAQMRGAESGLGADVLKGFGKDRDDAVRNLELRAALVGGCLVVAVAVSAAVARTLTRPLAAVRLGTARVAAAPATADPVRFTGRNDEFAEVVRSVNALHATVLALTSGAPSGGAGAALAAGATTSGTGTAGPTATAGQAGPAGPAGQAGAAGPAGQAGPMGQAGPASQAGPAGAAAASGEPAEDAAEARLRADGAAAAVPALTAEERAELQDRIAEVTGLLRESRHTIRHTFVNLSLRNLGLVERQLGVIESLEEREQDPERLATLYKLDHMATVMRRHSENLLVLAEHEQSHPHADPVPLVDVLRAAVSEIERYERVTLQTLPPHAQIAGYAADDLSHLVAELLENAASFSPPDAGVELSGWLLETGEVMLSVVDQGIGATDDALAVLNARLAGGRTTPAPGAAPGDQAVPAATAEPDGAPAEGLGLRVTALLAARHGVRVELRRQQEGGGVTAVVILPQRLLPSEPPAVTEAPTVSGSASAVSLPGAVAEANSHVLPVRPGAPAPQDPLIAAAEASVRAVERAGAVPAVPPHGATASGTGDAPTRPAEPADAAVPAEPAEGPGPAGQPAEPVGLDAPVATTPPVTAEPPPPARTAAASATPAPSTPAPSTPAPSTPALSTSAPSASASSAPAPTAAASATPDPSTPAPAGARVPRVPAARMPGTPAPRSAGDPYAIGPDSHERAHRDGSSALDQDTFTMRLPGRAATPGRELPKRVPKPARTIGAPPARKRDVDPEELRRRLGGFHQGAKAGRHDAEEEIRQSARHAPEQNRTAQQHTEAAGETVEEAHS